MAKSKRTKTETETALVAPVATKEQVAAAKAQAKAEAKATRAEQTKIAREAGLARNADAHAEIARRTAAETARRRCLCGCGATTPRAFFVPGHDAKLASLLAKGDVAQAA